MSAPPPLSRARLGIATAISLAALLYSVIVLVVAARAPDKGFLAFTGRRVVTVDAQGHAARAGVKPGDVMLAIDGHPIPSTMAYVDRMHRRRPGDRVELTLRRGDREVNAHVELARSPLPWPAIAATVLAAILLCLGLIARVRQPGDVAARRFWRMTVAFAMVYAGVLSWPQLLVHPILLALVAAAMFFASPLVVDFSMVFPARPQTTRHAARWLIFVPPAVLLGAVGISTSLAVRDFRAGAQSDEALSWTVRFITLALVVAVLGTIAALASQIARTRRATGAERSQAKWLLVGFVLSSVPMFASVPVAFADLDKFLLHRFRPFLIASAILWFAANSLAVLRIRLADVDSFIHRSAVYALASGAVVSVYLAVVFATGVIVDWLTGSSPLVPHVVAALAAGALFGPLRAQSTRWLDRRFFRDRVHYVMALRELTEAVARVQEPAALASEVVARSVAALRASSGALLLRGAGGGLEVACAQGADLDAVSGFDALVAPADGIVVPIGGDDASDGVVGALVFGPRRDGELYSTEDRDLLAALAGQIAVSLENARAYGTIAELGRALEAQNIEIAELRDRLEDENRYLKRRLAGRASELIGGSRRMRELRKQIERVAASDATVLITGESGSGKGLVARALHDSSDRADGPFIHVDCGSIPAGVIESELFGHERGAFTGATRKRRGHFELADGGTILLDEIGELPLDLQPRLLRVLQERQFTRVGGSEPVAVDARVLAATHRHLDDMVAAELFRQDLLYRLRVVEIEVPPLRARKSDLEALSAHLLPPLARRNGRPDLTLGPAALEHLAGYGWPGNVRELANVLERATVLCEGPQIGPADLAVADTPGGGIEELVTRLELPDGASHEAVMAAIEKQRLQSALRIAGNQSGAARHLGMARTTFINKLRRHDLV